MPTKLKAFELHGYKTFASRTEFLFADRVTAIIGPNGSGKSNIADALRWVLGEQSYSLLRGKKTEDMIFSGSETRSRAGMASATILFDNSDGWLPIDFTEVAITRRAYRDGQNEYLLNGQRVRLKDVSELLAQSGLAERTYTVIGQGLVDAALSLKADERRRLFEEAAGIGLYRSRKEEALRRLEYTHRNIERVQDILVELQPRLRSLERQAKRTNEYERIKADLKVYLLDWYGYHWHQSQAELARVKGELRNQEILLNKARNAQNELDKQITSIRDRIQDLREQLAQKHKELSNYHSRKEFVTREIAVTNERIRSLNFNYQNMQDELYRHHEDANMLDQRLSESENEFSLLKSELKDTQIQFEESKQNLENYQARRSLIIDQLERLKSELTEALTQQANFEAHESRILEQDIQRKESLESINQSINDIQVKLKELESGKHNLESSLREARSVRKRKEEAFTNLQQKIKRLLIERDHINKNIAIYTAEHSRVQAELDVLEQAENSFQGYAEGTKLLLSAMRENRLSGALGNLTMFLNVPARLETAIASVLGEYADAFLVDDLNGVEQALNVLEKDAIRGILIPMNSVDPYSPLKELQAKVSLDSDEFIGIASELIEVPEKFKKVVDLLLGHVIIVKDRFVAKKITSSNNHPDLLNLRVVTLKGEVFHLRGPIITGSVGQTILSRPRRKKELDQELNVISRQLDDHKRNLSKLEEDYIQQNEKISLSEKEVTNSIAYDDRLDKELLSVEADIENAKANIKWQVDQREKIEKENLQRSADLRNIQEKLLDVDSSLSTLKMKIQEKESALQTIPLVEQQAQYTFWNSRVAVLERGLTDQQKNIENIKSTQVHALETTKSIQARLNQIMSDLDDQEIKVSNLTKEESVINDRISELQEIISPIETEVQSLEHNLLNIQKDDVETRQALSAAEHNYAQSRIAFSHVQDRLERLRHRIEDDFGLVEYQYADEISGPTPLPLDGLVEKLPVLMELPIEIDEIIQRLRSQMRRIGPINPEAQIEFNQVSERITFLNDQLTDLQKAELDIREIIAELDLLMEREFRWTFDKVAQEFRQIFTLLFGGGAAKLELTAPDDMNETGIEIIARLPGRREQGLSLLSGGERSLTASALIFALLRVSPPPFCVLDEVDAMLDEANVGRFSDMLRDMSQNTQFIVVTHNRGTIQAADVLYGVTMGRDSSSQVISLKLEDVTEEFGV